MVASEHVDLDFDAADALRVVVVQVAARRLIGRPIGLHAGLHAKVEATAPSVEREVAVSTEVDPAKPRGGRELREACTRAELSRSGCSGARADGTRRGRPYRRAQSTLTPRS